MYSQEPATGPYPAPFEFRAHPHTLVKSVLILSFLLLLLGLKDRVSELYKTPGERKYQGSNCENRNACGMHWKQSDRTAQRDTSRLAPESNTQVLKVGNTSGVSQNR